LEVLPVVCERVLDQGIARVGHQRKQALAHLCNKKKTYQPNQTKGNGGRSAKETDGPRGAKVHKKRKEKEKKKIENFLSKKG